MSETKKKVNNSAKTKTQPKAQAKKAKKGKKNNQKKMLIAVLALILVGAAAFLGIYLSVKSAVEKVPADKICNNVYVDETNLSGMSAEEAKSAIAAKVEEYQTLTVDLIAEEAKVQVTLQDLGFATTNMEQVVEEALSYGKEGSIWNRYSQIKDLEESNVVLKAEYAVDAEAIATIIAEKIPELENAAKDATIKRENGKFVITDHEKGVAIDAAESTKAIETYFNETWNKQAAEIELVTTVDEPEVTREELEMVTDVLGTFTTHCGGTGSGRVQNIITGAGHINGSLIMPGEEFSADGAMRPYTYDNGFTTAGSYENGKVVQSMGGGICQVSSTLYNAAILAELEITQRMPHSMLVDYVKPSMDAAIAGDYKDLKFKNNTEYPIYLEGYVSGGYITFTIYGHETRPESRKIEFVSETISTTPAKKEFTASGDALGTITKTGSSHTGMKARLWKVVYENGKEVSREQFNSSNYISSPATYTVGTATDNAQAKAVVVAAIATNDEAKINAAIAQAKQIIADANKPVETPQQPSTPSETPSTGETGTETPAQ